MEDADRLQSTGTPQPVQRCRPLRPRRAEQGRAAAGSCRNVSFLGPANDLAQHANEAGMVVNGASAIETQSALFRHLPGLNVEIEENLDMITNKADRSH